jgi:hypothetical protein
MKTMTTQIPKPFWSSKTLWINLIALVAAISTAFGVDLGLDPEAQIAIVGTVMSVINIVLRFVTKAPISTS